MTETPPPLPEPNPDEDAIQPFQESEQRLEELLGGKPDSILPQDGQEHLLRDAQEMLRQSEARFRNMFVASATGMAVAAPLGPFLEVNAAYCQILGYTREELLNLTFASVTHADDLELNIKLRDEIVAGKRDSFVMEKRYLRKDGGSIWVNHSVSATRTSTGEVGTFVVVAEDITERRAAEQRLTRLNRLHSVLSGVSQSIMRIKDRQELYEKICQIVVERGMLRVAFIAEFSTTTGITSPVACSGGGLPAITQPKDVIDPCTAELLATVIRTGVYAVCNEICAADHAKAGLGLHTSAAFPFSAQGETIGILVLRAGEADYFNTDEIGLMLTVAENLAFATGVIESEKLRQKAEAKSNHLAAIVESSADAILSEDLTGIVTSWNTGATNLLGYTAAEMVGCSIRLLIPAERQDEEDRIIDLARQGQSLQNLETFRKAKDGRLINVSVTASPIKNSAGKIIGLSKLIHDTTEAKKSEARFRRLVDSSAQAVCFWNKNGAVTSANDTFLALIGYTREDLEAGRIDWVALTPPEYAELDRTCLQACSERGFCKPYEKEYIKKSGSRVHILIGSAAFDDNREEGVSFVVDLTEWKKLEQQFRQAQKMEAIGNLAGGVAHDFNNILAVIQIQADFLKSAGKLSVEQTESMDDIIAAVERAASLTRQLLLFSSRETYETHEIDLSESISTTIKMLTRLVGEQIQTQFKMAPQPMFIDADPGMIDQVLLNLVVNARDAMPNGGHLVIETSGVEFDQFAMSHAAQMRTGAFVCLSVSDSGCGIPPENMSRIFEPFFTTKEVGKGTGLGLATVFGIVQQHKGWINVYSEVGYGTTFRIYLPRLTKNARPKPSTLDLNANLGGNETILLVEDDPRLRNSIRAALSHLGYNVIEAQDAISALDIFRAARGDMRLLLTDLVMPGKMTGRQLAKTLTKDDPNLKVIYMSGYSVEVASKDFPLKEGVNFLSKPFSAIKLTKTVRDCLDAREIGGQGF